MDAVDRGQAALAPLFTRGIVKWVGPGAMGSYSGGLQPPGTPVAVDVIGDPEQHRAEIDRLIREAGIQDHEVRLSVRKQPG
jgi:hypothetical protein